MPSRAIDLPCTHEFSGWKICYNLLESTENSISASISVPTRNIVFVHGTPWSSIVYQPTIASLLAFGGYRILVYDLPGYGQSQEYDGTTVFREFAGDTSVKFQAEALSALLKHVRFDGKDGNPAPAVIAHDIAGAIVLRAHLIHGCNFDSMLLADTNTVLPWGDGFYKLARAEARVFLQLPPGIYEAVLGAVIQSAVHDTAVLSSGWQDALAAPWAPEEEGGDGARAAERQRSFVRQIAQANDEDVAEMLEGNMYERVRCDVKIVWGEKDQWIPKGKIEDLIARLQGKVKERAYIPDAGHLVMLDQPERFAVEIYDWLTRYGTERSPAKQ